MKRLLAFFLCLMLCLLLIPAALAVGAEDNAILASGDCGAEYWDEYTGQTKRYPVNWTLTTDGVLTISGTGKMGRIFQGDNYVIPWEEYKNNISAVVINSGVTSVGMFEGCTRLKSVSIPSTVTELLGGCFSECRALTTVVLPDGITSIPLFCFSGCTALKSISIPSSVTSIGLYAFAGCGGLSSISLPTQLKTIGQDVFSNCDSLKTVSIPASVTEIGSGAFLDCDLLTAINVSSSNAKYSSLNGALYNKEKTIFYAYPGGKNGDFTMPNTVFVIAPSAFSYCKKLGKVTISNNVSMIPERCFDHACLSSIVIPSSVDTIDNMAFYFCEGLKNITIPASVESIGSAFSFSKDLGTLFFCGDAPTISDTGFSGLGSYSENTRAFYPSNAKGWDKAINSKYGANYLTWLPCEKPSVKTHPKSQTVYPDKTASFTAEANTNVTYQWYYRTSKDGEWKIWSGKTDATLKVGGAAFRDGYQFRCKMTNPLGSATTYAATLYVSKPKITTQPADKTAAIGATAKFEVKADGASGYQWQYRVGSTGTWRNSSSTGADTATLSVEATNARNGYQFRCKVTNVMGSAYSEAATLTALAKPAVTTQPSNKTAATGATAKFTVKASGKQLSYQWQYRTSSSGTWRNSGSAGADTATLSVEATSARNGYQFRCKVTNPVGTAYSDAATLTVMAVPTITTQPASKTAAPGNTVKFTVKASGKQLSYQWQYRKTPDGSWLKCGSEGATSRTLSVAVMNYHNGYQFRCKVTNPVGTAYSNAATLTVMALPAVTTQPTDKDAAIGSTAKFTVKASGEQLSYQWQYRKTPDGSWLKCGSEGATSRTLSVAVMNYHNGYQFRCKVTNPVGTAYSNAATLTVMAVPSITTQPGDKAAAFGSTANFTVEASGKQLSYQWQYRKTPDSSWIKCSSEGATSRTLSVAVMNYHSGYQFRCKVSNPVGTVYSEAATLTAMAAPEVTTQPQSRSAQRGETVSFTVKVSGRELSYQWYYRKTPDSSWIKCSSEGATSRTLTVAVMSYHNGYQFRCKVSNPVGTTYSEAVTLTVVS